MPGKGYKSLTLPEAFLKEIEKIITDNPELGYTTVTEFAKDAIRQRIESVKKRR